MLLSRLFHMHKIYRMQNEPSSFPPMSPISTDLETNLTEIQTQVGNSSDLHIRRISVGQIQAAMVFFDPMADKENLNENVLKPLMQAQFRTGEPIVSQLLNGVFTIAAAKPETSLNTAIEELLLGKTLILINGESQLIVIDSTALKMRSVEEPVTESVLQGPREGFIENIEINLSLIRRRIHNRNLQVETYRLGQQTNTQICLLYIRGIVKEELVAEVRRRLSKVRIESVLDSGYIAQWIEDHTFSLFPTIAKNEKPDIVAGKILEGRVAILVDGTPMALTMPTVLAEYFQGADDYYSRPYYASLIRVLRYLAFFISAFLPAIYIAFENFEKEMIPPPLLIGFSQSREGVPFPLAIEVLFMAVLFEWLREAGLRMPRPIGQAVSIVGALVIGEAAVSASMIGAPTVMIIAGAGITAFVVPKLYSVSTILRLCSIGVSGVFGLYGLFLFWYGIIVYLADVRSFGIPYLTPLAPLKLDEWKDFLVRFPLWWLKRHPESLETVSQQKSGDSVTNPPDNSSGGNRI